MKLGTTLRNHLAGSLGGLFDSGRLRLHAGTAPADPDGAFAGTLLADMLLPVSAFGAASGGTVAQAGQWFGTVLASGTAGCFRLSSKDGTYHLAGSVSSTAGSGELKLASTALVLDTVVQVTGFTLSIPAGS